MEPTLCNDMLALILEKLVEGGLGKGFYESMIIYKTVRSFMQVNTPCRQIVLQYLRTNIAHNDSKSPLVLLLRRYYGIYTQTEFLRFWVSNYRLHDKHMKDICRENDWSILPILAIPLSIDENPLFIFKFYLKLSYPNINIYFF